MARIGRERHGGERSFRFSGVERQNQNPRPQPETHRHGEATHRSSENSPGLS